MKGWSYGHRDANHGEIKKGLEKLGAVVWDTAILGSPALDMVVCWRGRCIPVEIKSPGNKKKLTERQRESIESLRAVGVESIVATCVEDVVNKFK